MSEPKINDGGPAFPRPATNHCHSQDGMTLRDYFAAAALQGMLANVEENATPAGYVEAAYEFADTMLDWRKRCEAQHEH